MSDCLGRVSNGLGLGQIKKTPTINLVSSANIARDATTVRQTMKPLPSLEIDSRNKTQAWATRNRHMTKFDNSVAENISRTPDIWHLLW